MKYRRNDGTYGDYPHSFGSRELHMLARYLDSFEHVIPLREAGDPGSLAFRHDVDHSIEHAVRFAEWEAANGWRSTYFVLFTAWYAEKEPEAMADCLDRISSLGHEIGYHSNAVAVAAAEFPARKRWETPATRLSDDVQARVAETIRQDLAALRYLGHTVTGTAAHGDIRCYEMGVYNDLRYTSWTLADFGLEYDADQLAATGYGVSDNHGAIRGELERREGVLNVLLCHPEHWALDGAKVRA